MTDDRPRIEHAMQAIETIIGTREDGCLYMRLLRRLKAELDSRQDDEAEVAALRLKVRRAAA
jgi:hypothetical protein